MSDGGAGLSLVFRVQGRLCALPLACVTETMRPRPIEAVAGAPRFVQGLAVVRGLPVPVVDAASLLGDAGGRAGRWVVLDVGARRVALAVESVLGVRAIPAASCFALPPLLQEVASEFVEAVGLLDAELLLVLQGGRLLSDDDSARLGPAGSVA